MNRYLYGENDEQEFTESNVLELDDVEDVDGTEYEDGMELMENDSN